MTSTNCVSPKCMSWDKWDDSSNSSSSDKTTILDPKISKFCSTFEVSNTESRIPTCTSPRLVTSSGEIIWGDWAHSFDPHSFDETVIIEASSTESSSKEIRSEIKSSSVLDPADASSIAPHLVYTLNRTCSKQSGETIEETAYEQEPIAEAKRDQTEDQLRNLRRDLQNGLLTKGEPATEDIMDKMSSCLSILESLKPSAISISVTRIPKLLRAILRIKEIPKDDELRFKERTQTLLNSLNIILEAEDLVKKSNLQPERSQHLVMDMSGPEEMSLIEKVQPASLSEGKMMEDRTKAPSSQILITDLARTDDEPEAPSQMHVHELNVGPKKSKTRKRKHSDTSFSNSGEKVSLRRSKRVKKAQDYLPQENIWISTALKWIENFVKESDGDTIQVKRTDLLELKNELEVWRTKDLNVTNKLELLDTRSYL
ncbi:hypothetical protein OCU04_009816 [Sclerotinia nivalis]|uniref:Uncharacterized protein n=1 Tax=Sclerotinia nivalis TaxID=352851 RepID=A0A9X0AFV9_9HELO|nr:hypothetical protein OCU04_009816 [Sclerotinia nivalis]